MAGKTVLVTGATGGIGLATTLGLAARAAAVGRAGHDADVVQDLGRQTAYVGLRGTGLERTFAVNHLAPFLLTNLLLDRLAQAPAARVVTVASNAQAVGRIDFDDLQGTHAYSGARAYNQSKLGNVVFTYQLAKRLHGSSVTANAVHPGVMSTSFGSDDPATLQRLLGPLVRPLMKTPTQGAVASPHLSTAPALAGATGGFYTRRGPKRSSRDSYDTEIAERLWRVSSDLTFSGTAARTGEEAVAAHQST